MTDLIPRSWTELQEMMYHNAWDASIGRFRPHCGFRGMDDVTYKLTTSLQRLGGDYVVLERHLLRNFRKYAARNMVPRDSLWNWIALAQHHGLPTRVLDWSFSPNVALHFATNDLEKFETDGVVWCVNYVHANRLLPSSLRDLLASEGANLFTVDLIDRAVVTLQDFERLSADTFAVFFEPPSLDDRIVNQWALFSALSSPTLPLEEWLALHPELFHRVIIPARLKWEIRDKLDQANVNERVLFPGLDGLCAWLHRQYSTRGPDPDDPQDP